MNAVDIARVQPDGMGDFSGHVLEIKEIVGHLRRSGHFRGALQTQHQQIQHQTRVLSDERGELKAADDAVRVGVVHIFVVDDDVVLGRHVIGDVVIDDQPQQSIQQRQINLFVQLLEPRFQHDVTFTVRRFPHILEVVDSLTPFVNEERWRFSIGRFDPGREEPSLIGLVPEILVQISVGDLLQRFDIINWNQLAVVVHKLDADLFEGALRQQVTLDTRQRLVRIVVRLFDETELFPLALIQL